MIIKYGCPGIVMAMDAAMLVFKYARKNSTGK